MIKKAAKNEKRSISTLVSHIVLKTIKKKRIDLSQGEVELSPTARIKSIKQKENDFDAEYKQFMADEKAYWSEWSNLNAIQLPTEQELARGDRMAQVLRTEVLRLRDKKAVATPIQRHLWPENEQEALADLLPYASYECKGDCGRPAEAGHILCSVCREII